MDYEIAEFSNQANFRDWLSKNHKSANGVWLRIYKKGTDVPSINYLQALDEALCFGWIDGQKKSYDEQSFLQKFTPRRPKSTWSKRNIEHVDRLTKAGLMTPSGLLEVEKAKADGRWEAAYDSPSKMELPEYFLKELAKHPKAQSFYDSLNRANQYAIAWRLQTAKSDSLRQSRTEKLIAMLNAGEKLH